MMEGNEKTDEPATCATRDGGDMAAIRAQQDKQGRKCVRQLKMRSSFMVTWKSGRTGMKCCRRLSNMTLYQSRREVHICIEWI